MAIPNKAPNTIIIPFFLSSLFSTSALFNKLPMFGLPVDPIWVFFLIINYFFLKSPKNRYEAEKITYFFKLLETILQ